jgi:hypothetical protein
MEDIKFSTDSANISVCNFVRVLALVKIDVNNDRLHVNELQIVKEAIQGLFYYLDISRFKENDVKELTRYSVVNV